VYAIGAVAFVSNASVMDNVLATVNEDHPIVPILILNATRGIDVVFNTVPYHCAIVTARKYRTGTKQRKGDNEGA
jgi:predicted dinucleotide-binding enzyme